MSRKEFEANEDVQLALVYLLQTIGEAARRVSSKTKSDFPRIPWPQITGMRHGIVHDYSQVNYGVVWETATQSIPQLIAELAPLVDPIIAEAKARKGKASA